MPVDYKAQATIQLPQARMVGLVPFIVSAVISAVEIVICFVQIVQGQAVFSPSIIQVHMTWGLIFSITLDFIENALRWNLNRRIFNVFGVVNFIVSAVFIIACLYTWLWANGSAGMAWICKNFLSNAGVSVSPQKIQRYIYTATVQKVVNVFISWLIFVQCCLVTVDCGLSVFRKGKSRELHLLLRTDPKGNILCRLDQNTLQ